MKLTPIDSLPENLPKTLIERFSGARIFDSSSSPEARVYFVEKDEGYFIKVGEPDTLRKEAIMTEYYHARGLGAKCSYFTLGYQGCLLTQKLKGSDLTSQKFLSNPRRMAAKMGELLRSLHETEQECCPVEDRTADYLATFEEGYRIGRFDPSYIDGRLNIHDTESAREYILKHIHLLKNEVLIHGDFCLPNIILDDWNLSGYIDLGGAGIGDRHIDLFWGAWTLNFNLGTEDYRDTFFDAYGKELVDEEKLLLISAIEAFG